MAIRLPSLNPNTRSYVSHFGRGFLLLLGVLAVVGLVVATFYYGDRSQEQTTEQTKPTEQAVRDDQNEAAKNQPVGEQNIEVGVAEQGQGGEPTESVGAPTPSQIADTGPEATIVPIMILSLLYFYFRRSQKTLAATINQ